MLFLILSLFGASADNDGRLEALSPIVVKADTSFMRTSERVSVITPSPERTPELVWGSLIEATRPTDILMEGFYNEE